MRSRYKHEVTVVSARPDPAHVVMPRVHNIAVRRRDAVDLGQACRRPIALSGKVWERLGVADVLVDLLKELVFDSRWSAPSSSHSDRDWKPG